jgi:outer membrane lipoprotein carrier protein
MPGWVSSALEFKKQFIVASVCVLFGWPAMSQENKSATDMVDEFVRSSKTMKARFTQITNDDAGQLVNRNAGYFWLLRPDKFRWDYEDTEQKIISNGENVYVYDIDLEQLTIRNLSVALDQSPSVALLMDGVNLQNLYEVSAVESGGGVIDWVALRPLAEDAGYEYLELGFSDQLLLVLRMEDLLGQKTIIQFDQVEINTEVSASIFEFKLPANVDVFYD